MARMGLGSVGIRYECSKCDVSADTRIIYHWYKLGHRGKSVIKEVSEYIQVSEDIKGKRRWRKEPVLFVPAPALPFIWSMYRLSSEEISGPFCFR
jgi:hypothetical protein